MNDRPADTAASRRRPTARSLREACEMAGRDDGGRRCPDCPLRELCESEARWLVQRVAPPGRYH